MIGYTLTIFDCDGVLVDSEPAANRVMVEMLGEIGFDITLADCMTRFVGKSMKTVQAEVVAEAGAIFPPGWPEAIRARTIETFQRERIKAIPGIHDVVSAHRSAGRPYCVASSGRIPTQRTTRSCASATASQGATLASWSARVTTISSPGDRLAPMARLRAKASVVMLGPKLISSGSLTPSRSAMARRVS